MSARSRWLDWKPNTQILAKMAEGEPTKPTERPQILAEPTRDEPTKPSKPGSVGFDGATSSESLKIQAEPGIIDLDFERGVSWAEWKAAALNRLFLEQGRTGQPGGITAETVRHGERSGRR